MFTYATMRSKGGASSGTTSTKPSKGGSGLTVFLQHPAVIALLFSAFAIALFTYWGDLRNTFSSVSNQSAGKTTYWVIGVGVLLAFALSRKFSWLKSPLFFGVIVAIGYFWQDLKEPVATWLATTTNSNKVLGVAAEEIMDWMWVIFPLLGLVWFFFLREKKGGSSTDFNLFDILVLSPISVSIICTMAVVVMIVSKCTGTTEAITSTNTQTPNRCRLIQDLNHTDTDVGIAAKCISINKDSRYFTQRPVETGYKLMVDFRKEDKERNPEIYTGRYASQLLVASSTQAGMVRFVVNNEELKRMGVETVNIIIRSIPQ